MSTTDTLQLILDTPYNLTQEQIESYRTNGHIYLPGLAELSAIESSTAAIREIIAEAAKQLKALKDRDTYGKAFIQEMNLWLRNEKIKKYVFAKRFAKVAAELLGVNSVRLYHDQALYKEPGGGYTPWHQDQQYWPLDGVKAVTMWMPLVDAKAEMGTLQFASRSQELGYLGNQNISDNSEQVFIDLIKEKGYPVTEAIDMKAGDATFHDGWVLHKAPGNASETIAREAMTVIFFDADAIISEPDSDARKGDLAAWFPGLKAGDAAASPINPILYP